MVNGACAKPGLPWVRGVETLEICGPPAYSRWRPLWAQVNSGRWRVGSSFNDCVNTAAVIALGSSVHGWTCWTLRNSGSGCLVQGIYVNGKHAHPSTEFDDDNESGVRSFEWKEVKIKRMLGIPVYLVVDGEQGNVVLNLSFIRPYFRPYFRPHLGISFVVKTFDSAMHPLVA